MPRKTNATFLVFHDSLFSHRSFFRFFFLWRWFPASSCGLEFPPSTNGPNRRAECYQFSSSPDKRKALRRHDYACERKVWAAYLSMHGNSWGVEKLSSENYRLTNRTSPGRSKHAGEQNLIFQVDVQTNYIRASCLAPSKWGRTIWLYAVSRALALLVHVHSSLPAW